MNTPPGDVALDVLDNLIEGCQVIGYGYEYLYVNDTVARQGQRTREELLGRTMMECYPGIESTVMFSALTRCMNERVPHRMENEFTFPDGTTCWYELHFIPVPKGTCILSVDIGERKRAQALLARSEEQLHHAQKMEAIGRLASGVSHDFNNILSVIISYASLARQNIDPRSELDADLEEIEKAAFRATGLIRQLLSFSRKQAVESRVIDINDAIDSIDSMLRRAIGTQVELRIDKAPSIGLVLGDVSRMEQILLNLAVNARDAMPDGGTLTIETANVILDEDDAKQHLGIRPGPHVLLAVSDTGIGMDAGTRASIFEPFFTTKQAAQGTGLGLSTVFGIVQQYNGTIWVYSEPDAGTTFKLYFPFAAGQAALAETHLVSERRAAMERPAHEPCTILVVDDNEQLRPLIAELLVAERYDVVQASGAEEAIRICKTHDGEIALLLTDVTMPGMSGLELAQKIRELRADIKVLFMSGYTEGVVSNKGALTPGDAFIAKPITPSALSRAVRGVLSRK